MNNINKVGTISKNKRLREATKNVHFKGLDKLTKRTYSTHHLYSIISSYVPRMESQVHNEYELTIHVKEHQKSGNQHRYEVNSRIIFPGGVYVSKVEDWDLTTGIRSSMESIQNQLNSRFKNKVLSHDANLMLETY